MSDGNVPSIEVLLKDVTRAEHLSRETVLAIAEHLEEALASSSRHPLATLADRLGKLVSALLANSDVRVRALARGQQVEDDDLRQAYRLGQTSFAQALASHAVACRADDDFVSLLTDRRYVLYVKALAQRDLTGVELAQVTGNCAETVSRKLKDLRAYGVTDLRREGTSVINFLTPSARAVLPAWPEVQLLLPRSEGSGDALCEIRKHLPSFLQTSVTFSNANDERWRREERAA